MAHLRVAGVRVERTPGHVAVTVNLFHDDTALSARVERPASESGGVQVAAEAALEAIRQVTPPGTTLMLQRATNQPVSIGSAVVAHIMVETVGGQEYLVGAALRRDGPLEDAAAAAVVDALDRRLTWLLR